jgi:hypothetical protein
MTIEESGFGTSATAFCIQRKKVASMGGNTMVDPANLDWNLLLADLRKLSTIVGNEEEENTAYEKPAAPTARQTQPVSNHSRL